jgi:hypothetical protein
MVLATSTVTATVVGLGVLNSYRVIDVFIGENGRDQAREWIPQNLPAGSVIAVESRTPWIDRSRFHVRRVPVSYSTSALWLKSPRWYAAQGFDYLVVSNRVQGLYSKAPSRYSQELRRYLRLYRELEVVQTFEDRLWSITILKVPDALRQTRTTTLPPWYLWSGEMEGHPMGPTDTWPVEIWRGRDEPRATCLSCAAASPRIPAWLERGRAVGLITQGSDAELASGYGPADPEQPAPEPSPLLSAPARHLGGYQYLVGGASP